MTNAIIITYKSQLVREKSPAPMGKDQCVSVNVCVREKTSLLMCNCASHTPEKYSSYAKTTQAVQRFRSSITRRIYTDTGKLPELSQSTH